MSRASASASRPPAGDRSPGTLLDLLLPRPCAACGEPAGPLCAGCRRGLPVGLHVVDVLRRDGTPLGAAAATTYTGAARELVLTYKEGGRHELVVVLGELLAHAVLGAALLSGRLVPSRPAPLLLVPVASRPANRRQRGADVGVLLARQAAALLRRAGWPAGVAPVLRHRRASRDQAGLGRSARARNVEDTLAVGGDPRVAAPSGRDGRSPLVLVTDDVLTTGATLAEAGRALAAVGHPPAGGAVVAVTPTGAGSFLVDPGSVAPIRPHSSGCPLSSDGPGG